jgi:hypothetical protein
MMFPVRWSITLAGVGGLSAFFVARSDFLISDNSAADKVAVRDAQLEIASKSVLPDSSNVPKFPGPRPLPENSSRLAATGVHLHSTNLIAFEETLRRLIGRDPTAAAEFCTGWGLDPHELQEILAKVTAKESMAFLRAYCRAIAKESPFEAVSLIRAIPVAAFPRDSLGIICASALRSGSGEVRHWLAGVSARDQAAILDDAYPEIQQLSGFSGRTCARAWLEFRLDLPDPGPGVFDAFRGLSSESSEALMHLAKKMPDKQQKWANGMIRLWQTTTLENAFLSDPTATWVQIQEMPSSERKEMRPDLLFSRYAEQNPREAWQFARHIPDSEIQDSVVLTIVGSVSQLPLSERRRIAFEHLSQIDQARGALVVSALMKCYAEEDPWAGSLAVTELANSPVRDAAIAALAKSWSQLDAAAASDWIAQLPAGRSRDLAVRELTSNSIDDPEVALQNVANINNAQLRNEAARTVFAAWNSLNPAWIAELARKAGFSESEIAIFGTSLAAGSAK